MEVVEEDAWRDGVLFGSEAGECISRLVFPLVNVFQLHAGKVSADLIDELAVCHHVGIVDILRSHRPLDDEVGVAVTFDTADSRLLGYM